MMFKSKTTHITRLQSTFHEWYRSQMLFSPREYRNKKDCSVKWIMNSQPTALSNQLLTTILRYTEIQVFYNFTKSKSFLWKTKKTLQAPVQYEMMLYHWMYTKWSHNMLSSLVGHFTYFSINFRWNSERSGSLMKPLDLPSSPLAQFLKTTSSSHLQWYKDNECETNSDVSYIV